jgi:predicted amidophosphoribosyltransferase
VKRLADLDAPVAAAVLDRLVDAGIVATTTDLGRGDAGITALHRGGSKTRVWIHDAADLPRAERILHDVLAVPTESARCPGCGYDLEGHVGATTCPECGLAVLAPSFDAETTCPACGEVNPAGFEVCWSCGGPLEPPAIAAGRSPIDAPVNRCTSCGEPVPAGAARCGACGGGIEAVGIERRRRVLSPGAWIALAFFLLFVVSMLLRGGW